MLLSEDKLITLRDFIIHHSSKYDGYKEKHHLNFYSNPLEKRGSYKDHDDFVKLLRIDHIFIHLVEASILYSQGVEIKKKELANLQDMYREIQHFSVHRSDMFTNGWCRKWSNYEMIEPAYYKMVLEYFSNNTFIFIQEPVL